MQSQFGVILHQGVQRQAAKWEPSSMGLAIINGLRAGSRINVLLQAKE